eukprot:ANDGO_06629.mRNA.1 hypothetical protein PPTG_02567
MGVPEISVTGVTIRPEDASPLSSALDLELVYGSSAPIANATWDLKYVVDCAATRHVIELGRISVGGGGVVQGENTIAFSTPGIDFTGIKRSVLLNVGLLIATLFDESSHEQVIQVSFVVQIESKDDKSLWRTIFSPLE